MKDAKTSKEAIKIFDAIEGRIEHLWNKLTSGNYNAATMTAFQIGTIMDIDEALQELKIKRTIVKQEGVQEIEFEDIEKGLKILDDKDE